MSVSRVGRKLIVRRRYICDLGNDYIDNKQTAILWAIPTNLSTYHWTVNWKIGHYFKSHKRRPINIIKSAIDIVIFADMIISLVHIKVPTQFDA